MKKIVLGSTSPFRKEILNKLKIEFICDKPNIDETALPDESAIQLVERLAIEKAQAVAKLHDNALIIGSDQVALCNEKILGKPHTKENAIKQLMSFSGKRVTFYTGLCVLDSDSGQIHAVVEPFHVYFKTLNKADVERYVDAEMPLNCAGSFKSEGLGICLFEKLVGDDPNSLVGLPLIKLIHLFEKHGFHVLQAI
ncbi:MULTISPECIES: Maf family protein [Thalassotalea]|uniref:Maf family protein n=1 Tax=Thalassotalea TaxID=1518149 RepID=UPI00094262D5|nr:MULTISPECIES: nucleoside triphosphate pyrophosphatase [Thalassotalea]OKY25441.1 septum formation protein Maf [Thalassotalea sp. PP2-459]